MNRRTAIRRRCIECSAGNLAEVRDCTHTDCHLFPYRSGQGKQAPVARDKAIRSYCLWCNVSRHEVILCPVTDCPLYPFRKSEVDRPTRRTGISLNRSHTGNFKSSNHMSIPMEPTND